MAPLNTQRQTPADLRSASEFAKKFQHDNYLLLGGDNSVPNAKFAIGRP